KVSPLGVGIVAVDISSEHQATLVGLADVEVTGTEGNNVVDQRLYPFRDERLHHVTLDRQAQACHGGKSGTTAGDGQPHLIGADRSSRRLNTGDVAVRNAKAGDFAVLDNIDAASIRGSCVSPHNGVMPRRAGAPLEQTAVDRKPRVVEIEIGYQRPYFIPIKQFRVDAVKAHGVAASGKRVSLK